MTNSSSNVIDYFAVLGKVAGPLACKKIPIGWNESSSKMEFHPSDLWAAAITDISIIFVDKGEVLPDDGWEVLKDTIDGSPANLNSGDLERGLAHIAIRRRAHSKRVDHLVEVSIMQHTPLILPPYSNTSNFNARLPLWNLNLVFNSLFIISLSKIYRSS